jgi:hypothetical protein
MQARRKSPGKEPDGPPNGRFPASFRHRLTPADAGNSRARGRNASKVPP